MIKIEVTVFRKNMKKRGLTSISDTKYDEGGSLSFNMLNTRKRATASEEILYKVFKEYGIIPVPQYRLILKNKTYIVDFAFPGFKIAVECDGKNHNATIQKNRDIKRDKLLWRYGWRVVRLQDKDIFEDPYECARIIYDEMVAWM